MVKYILFEVEHTNNIYLFVYKFVKWYNIMLECVVHFLRWRKVVIKSLMWDLYTASS